MKGKKSCRRRLAGHNRRRRKTHPDTIVSGSSLSDDTTSRCLLINLLNALTNLHSDNSDKLKDQDFLSHLLGNIASLAGSSDSRNLSGTLQASQDLHAAGTSTGLLSKSANNLLSSGVTANESLSNPLCSPSKATCNRDSQGSLKSANHPLSVPAATLEMTSRENIKEVSPCETVQAVPSKFSPTLKFAEDVLSAKGGPLCSLQEAPDCGVGCDEPIGLTSGAAKSIPPQTGCNSESLSVCSLSSTDGDAQSQTDRIVFKLFGKDPNDVPLFCEHRSLTGCPTLLLIWIARFALVVLFSLSIFILMILYGRRGKNIFEPVAGIQLIMAICIQLNHNLCSSLNRLLCTSGNGFWRTGWIYARLQNHMAFICNGNIVLDATPMILESTNNCQIVCVTPVAVAVSARVNFTVQGFNLAQPTTRLLCAFEGKYLGTETAHSLFDDTDPNRECDGYQCFNFSCSLPDATGRGVIEVGEHGVSSDFFPFVVEEEDVCVGIKEI